MPSEVPNHQFEWQAPPPGCGKRLPPVLIDEIAAEDPDRVLYSIAKTERMKDGFRDITYKTVANAVNRCAHWLKESLGSDESRVFCYLGPLDLRYLILVMAAPKAGHIAFFSSHRNSLEAHVSLVKRTGCSAFLLPDEPLPIASHILKDWPMASMTVPGLDYFLNEEHVEIVYFRKTYEEVKNEPFCILHTSGSTGIPKPVNITYGSYSSMDAKLLLPSLGYAPTYLSYTQGKRIFFALPMFHAASLNWTVGMALFAGVTCVLPPPVPLTAELASQIFQHSRSDGAQMAPALLVDCYNNDTYCMRLLQNLKFVAYGGGMLPEEIGDVLCQRIRLLTLMGSCETSLLPHQMLDDPRDWEYISLSPCLGHTFRDDRDGLGNLTIVRQKKFELHQGVFSTFPEKKEHVMGDLFEPHPLKAGLWRYRGRADDIISFTTAEKLNPSTMENIIQGNALVRSAVVGGQGYFQASLLLEPREYPKTPKEEQTFLDQVWPTIVQANRGCPAHGRIMKGFVMLTDPSKPLPRASKDTVQRHAVFKLYEAEWKSLYQRMARFKEPLEKPASEKPGNHLPSSLKTGQYIEQRPDPEIAMLSDDMTEAVEVIVDRKVTAALKNLAAALRAAAHALDPTSPMSFPAGGKEDIPVSMNGNPPDALQRTATHSAIRPNGTARNIDVQVRQIIFDTLAEILPDEDFDDDTDLFKFGLDSLQVSSLLTAINAFIVKSQQPVDLIRSEIIYSNPTISQMVAVVTK